MLHTVALSVLVSADCCVGPCLHEARDCSSSDHPLARPPAAPTSAHHPLAAPAGASALVARSPRRPRPRATPWSHHPDAPPLPTPPSSHHPPPRSVAPPRSSERTEAPSMALASRSHPIHAAVGRVWGLVAPPPPRDRPRSPPPPTTSKRDRPRSSPPPTIPSRARPHRLPPPTIHEARSTALADGRMTRRFAPADGGRAPRSASRAHAQLFAARGGARPGVEGGAIGPARSASPAGPPPRPPCRRPAHGYTSPVWPGQGSISAYTPGFPRSRRRSRWIPLASSCRDQLFLRAENLRSSPMTSHFLVSRRSRRWVHPRLQPAAHR